MCHLNYATRAAILLRLDVFNFGGGKSHIFYLAKGDKILTDDAEPLTLVTRQFAKGPGGKTYPELLDWHWHTEDGDMHLALRDAK